MAAGSAGLHKKPADPAEAKAKLDAAVEKIKPQLAPLLQQGIPEHDLRARHAIWKNEYQLTALELHATGDSITVRAKVNPEADAGQAKRLSGPAERWAAGPRARRWTEPDRGPPQ